MNAVTVVGAGLAGCEAAWQIAKRGVRVELYEMKPHKMTPAHHSEGFAELVCSNSLRSDAVTNAVGLLKEEMRILGSLVMEAADTCRVEAGSALAVDRTAFSTYITDKIKNHPLITVHEEEICSLPDVPCCIIATGPLTSDSLAEDILVRLKTDNLSFFDAAAPIVDAASIDMSKVFFASRYGKGEPTSYLNCPMTKEQYETFYNALITAKEAQLKDFDKDAQGSDLTVFESCMPVEVMAKRGVDTLRFGPMKPVGLPVPETGKDAYATVQLRRENDAGTMFNIVGFQTHLTFDEQKRVFSLIPGLENAVFLRYGVMHRNTFLDSPKLLASDYSLRSDDRYFFAGQMTGVEGYVESASSGLLCGIFAAYRMLEKEAPKFPSSTAIGALANYVSCGTHSAFQPMNVNFGIIDPLPQKVKGGKQKKNEALAARALDEIKRIADEPSF